MTRLQWVYTDHPQPTDVQAQKGWKRKFSALEFQAEVEMLGDGQAPEITLGWEMYSNTLEKGVVNCGENCSLHSV